jgi:hypothetical protein
MKRWTLVVLALMAAGAIAAGAATAAPSPAQLQRQIKALQKQVRVLENEVASLVEAADQAERCESVMSIARYGGLQNEGYVYGMNGGADVFLTSALDVLPVTAGEDPDSFRWFVVVDDACISTGVGRPEARGYPRALPFTATVERHAG